MTMPPALQNLSLPVIASPMFIASGPARVAAQCKAGIVGSFPALNARPAELLDTWLTDLQRELADYQEANPGAKVGPIAVNQIVHGSNDRLAHDVEVCVKPGRPPYHVLPPCMRTCSWSIVWNVRGGRRSWMAKPGIKAIRELTVSKRCPHSAEDHHEHAYLNSALRDCLKKNS